MLSKIIELKDIKDGFVEYKSERDITKDMIDISMFMEVTIEAFKTLTDEIVRLEAKVKKLEQQNSYYPTEEEISNIKAGGTD